MGLMRKVRAFFHWFRFLARLRDLERMVAVLKACPCCGAVLVVGHDQVAIIEVAPGVQRAVCRWGKAQLERTASLRELRKRRA
jgi:hypothetical protein